MMIDTIIAELDERGFSVCSGLPYEEFERISAELGKEIMSTSVEVTHQDAGGPLVTSAKPLSLHTDHHAMKYIGWYCHRHDPDGGESILSDSRQFLGEFSQEEILELKNIKLFEHDIYNKGEEQYCPMLCDGEDNNLNIYFSFWLADSSAKANPSFKKFVRLADNHIEKFHLHSGDCLIIDNQRVMHGRTQIINLNRKLERKWLC